MILHLFRRTPRERNIAALYGMIVAQARSPAFYRDYGVPDTVNGRFEMIALLTVLLLNCLEGEPELRELGQGVFDLFCREMDASMREMGVGDLSVPRKMRRIGAAFYDRQAQYLQALAAEEQPLLAEALAKNVFADAAAAGAGRLAAYVRVTASALAAQDARAFARSDLQFSDPANIAVTAEAVARM